MADSPRDQRVLRTSFLAFKRPEFPNLTGPLEGVHLLLEEKGKQWTQLLEVYKTNVVSNKDLYHNLHKNFSLWWIEIPNCGYSIILWGLLIAQMKVCWQGFFLQTRRNKRHPLPFGKNKYFSIQDLSSTCSFLMFSSILVFLLTTHLNSKTITFIVFHFKRLHQKHDHPRVGLFPD